MRTALIALCLVLPTPSGLAQPTSLAGRWSLIAEDANPVELAPQVPATASSGWGHEFTVALDGTRLTIERHQFAPLDVQPPMLFVYVLGAPENRNVVNVGQGSQLQLGRATLRGQTLPRTRWSWRPPARRPEPPPPRRPATAATPRRLRTRQTEPRRPTCRPLRSDFLLRSL